jgi:HEAT repeat protein
LNDEIPEGGAPEELSEQYVNEAVLFVVNWHAATVNMRLYPPTSSMVTDTVESARTHLEKLFEWSESFSVSVLENSLLVNDVRLEEIEQQKAPVKSFVQWMNERMLTHLAFAKGVTSDEMTNLFEVLASASDKDHRENLAEKLAELGVSNVVINQRVYVAISAGEEYADGVRKASPLDALKDELLMRYLMGQVDMGQVQDKELVDVLSDPGKVGGLLSTFISVEGSEGGVLVRSQKAEEALSTLSTMVDQVTDPALRDMLSGQIGSIISEMTPREMTSMLTGESPENLNIRHVRERVITMLSDNQLLEMVDSLIDEYMEMKSESDELETEWTREKLRNLNELLIEVREDRGDAISEVIDHKLEVAGVEEERDPGTGRRVLSAYQLLGGPLDEEFVKLEGDIDQEVTEQVRRLYAMEEDDLAAGMLTTLAANLKQESPSVRRFAAELVKETLESLEREYQLLASEVLEKTLVEDIIAEYDYAAYVPQVDSVAVIARRYMQEGMTERASEIVDLLKEQTDPEQDKGQELVKHAGSVVEMLTGPEGMIDMHALLLEEDEEKRLNTVRALAELGPNALVPLVDIVKDRGDIDLRDRALDALQSTGEVGVEALLGELGKKNPWYVYRNILNVVADLKLEEAVEPVGAMVSNPDERIRREALRSLARIGSSQSVPTVLGAANDPSLAVRRTAVRVLGMFGDSSVAPFLMDLINSQGPRGRDEDQAVMEAACLALGDLQDTGYIPQLTELLGKGGLFKKARPDEIRAAACIALGAIGDDRVVPVLERSMKDPSMMVRSSAEKALRKLSGAITTPEPINLEEDVEPGVAAAVVQPEQEVYRPHRPPPHREAAPPPVAAEGPVQAVGPPAELAGLEQVAGAAPLMQQPEAMEVQPVQEPQAFEELPAQEPQAFEELPAEEVPAEPFAPEVLEVPVEAAAPEHAADKEPFMLTELKVPQEMAAVEEQAVVEPAAVQEEAAPELEPVEEHEVVEEQAALEHTVFEEPATLEETPPPPELEAVESPAAYEAEPEPEEAPMEYRAPEEPLEYEAAAGEPERVEGEPVQPTDAFEPGQAGEMEARERVEFEEEIAAGEMVEPEETIELEEEMPEGAAVGLDEAFEEPSEIERLLKQEGTVEAEGAAGFPAEVEFDEVAEVDRPTEIERLIKEEEEGAIEGDAATGPQEQAALLDAVDLEGEVEQEEPAALLDAVDLEGEVEQEEPAALLDAVELEEEVEQEEPAGLLDTVDLDEAAAQEEGSGLSGGTGLEDEGPTVAETAAPAEPEARAAPRLPAPPEWVEMPAPDERAPAGVTEDAEKPEQPDLDQLEWMYLEDIDKVEELELPAAEASDLPGSEPDVEPTTIDRFLQEEPPPAEPAYPSEREGPQPEGLAGPGQDVELPPEWRLPGETAAPAPRVEPTEASGFLLAEASAAATPEEAAPVEPPPPIEAEMYEALEPPAEPGEPSGPPEIPEEDVVFPEELVEETPPVPGDEEAEGSVEFEPTNIEGFMEGTAPPAAAQAEPPAPEEAPPPLQPEQAAAQAPPPPETPSWMEPTQVPYPPRPPGENPPAPPTEPPPPSRWK